MATSLDSEGNCTKRYDAERSHKRLTHTGFNPTRVRDKSSLQRLLPSNADLSLESLASISRERGSGSSSKI
jgi:hypothetical protein